MKIYTFFAGCIALVLISTSCSKTDSAGSGSNSIATKTMTDVAYGTDPLQKMDIYLPANRTVGTTKVMILIHGGAWISGDKADFGAFIDTLKNRIPDYAIINLNYRLASTTFPPINTFPTQENDIKAAIGYIYGNRNSYLISDKFVIMGASAGGHLSLLQAYKNTAPVKIKAVVDFFGPTDMVDMYNNPGAFSAASIAFIMNGTPTTNAALYQQSSPLTFATATACPTIILQGGLDPLVNATRQSEALKNQLTAANVINQYVFYPLGGHGDWDTATNTDAFNKISAFLAANVQ